MKNNQRSREPLRGGPEKKVTYTKMTEKKMTKKKTESAIAHRHREARKGAKVAETLKECKDIDCNIHGKLKTHGRIFEGTVTKKFKKRIVIELERTVYVRKYERYTKSRTKLHARLPICLEASVNIGDLVQIQECRPLSKIIHFVFIKSISHEHRETLNKEDKSGEEKK
jgi:small subunit ribosomal protein S17